MRIYPAYFAGMLAMLLASVVNADSAGKVTFDQHIQPILRAKCLNCHNAGDAKGGLALDTYTALLEGGGSGEIVFDDGDADGSRFWQLVNHDDTPVMPPNSDKLPAKDLQLIRSWIEGGILENDGSVAAPKKKNALAAVQVTTGRPAEGGAMPGEKFPQETPVETDRAAAVTAIAAAPWAPLVAIAGQKQIVLYRTDNHRLAGVLPFEHGIPQSIRFNVSGSHLIVGGGKHSVAGRVVVYDVVTGEAVATIAMNSTRSLMPTPMHR